MPARIDFALSFCTCVLASVILVLISFALIGAGEVDPPYTSVLILFTFAQSLIIISHIALKINQLINADLLTHPTKTLIIDAYLGESKMAKDKKVEPTKAQLVREVEAKLGFRKFELNSLERANKATIVALLVR